MKGLNSVFMFIFLLILLGACKQINVKQEEGLNYRILPVPVKMLVKEGSFSLSNDTKISTNDTSNDLNSMTEYLSSEIDKLLHLKIGVTKTKSTDSSNIIFLVLDTTVHLSVKAKSGILNEAYTLVVDPDKIVIRGQSTTALFYGVQSFLQLIYPNKENTPISIPAMEIQDYPQFSWRGMHFDVCRHFFSTAFIKKMIDGMAMHKLNTFHWHLTDDQGWRIEIKKYPLLTSIGGWRNETVIGHMSGHPLKYDGKKYGGFYTQEEIKEVVAYAKSRYITIVPEIEMPGHAMAALSAYPEYSCTGGPFNVFTEWGVADDVFCAGKEKTYGFMEDILNEVTTLFPGNYIHVGGDECPKKRWNACADCKQRMKSEKLKDAFELQSYFIKRIETFLTGKGKKLIGWDEILEGGLPENATVMSWKGEEGGIVASNEGHNVVMTPGKYCYFDHCQGDVDIEPLSIGGFLPLDSVYSYNPLPKGLDSIKLKHILGAQANVWTEYITTEEHFEYMVYPRLCAMAEILWSPKEKRNYNDFTYRMDMQYLRLDKKNINYRVNPPSGFDPINKFMGSSAAVSMHCDIPFAEIRYTTDGTEPVKSSLLYTKPILISLKEGRKKILAKTFMPNGKTSTSLEGIFESIKLLKGQILLQPKKGVVYNYYDKSFSSATKINGEPTKSGIIDSLSFPEWIPFTKEWFAFTYTGYLKIDKEGLYNFFLKADDGANLYIDDELVVNNDGYHYTQEKFGYIGLGEGYHSIRLNYFEGKYSPTLEVRVMSKEITKQKLPLSMLWHK